MRELDELGAIGASATIRVGGSEKQASSFGAFHQQDPRCPVVFESLLYLLPSDKGV